MIFGFDYASPSVFESTPDRALLGLAADTRRPVRFHGRIARHGFLLRFALRAVGEVVWSDDTWEDRADILDPVITVHDDRLFFEAFSQDQSVYACLHVDRDVFEVEGEVVTGTTNVDFTAWLWGAIGEMRTSRDTRFRIGPEGFEVRTVAAGGRFERRVDLPEPWIRGFLQLQAAMAMPGTRLRVRPIDLLSALRYMRYTKARVSPRALRYEFEPGEDATLILEPWEHAVTLRGAEHDYTERRVIRTWGRRRLRLIEGLLPFAESVDVYLKGRALPSFYAVKLPGMTLVVGLSGWTRQGWSGTGSFDLLAETAADDDELLDRALELIRQRVQASLRTVAETLGVDPPRATRLMIRLSRQGLVTYDVETRHFRHRELFLEPLDDTRLFPPDRRVEEAARMLEAGDVRVERCQVEETRKTKRLKTPDGPATREIVYRDWRVRGTAGGRGPVEIVVADTGRIIFGRCRCPFFEEHLLNRGPCEHMLALFKASAGDRLDLPTSTPESDGPPRPSRAEMEYDADDD